jgi:hypothetical protein
MPYIRGHEVQKGPKQIPANPKLWNMYVAQAKARFRVYPSPVASSWVHTQYVKVGGQFVEQESQIDPRMRDYADEAQDKRKEAQKKQIKKPVGRSTLAGRQFRG